MKGESTTICIRSSGTERGAGGFFNALPSYVQDRIGPRYQSIDRFGGDWEEYAVNTAAIF